jgi:hypothetical protein
MRVRAAFAKCFIACLAGASITACSGVVRGSDTRDLDKITLAQPSIAGGDVGVGCGFEDDPCRGDLICNEKTWTCTAPDPPPLIACTRDVQCPLLAPSCNQGLCAALGSAGASCGTSANCLPGFQCSEGGACRSIRTWCTSTSGCPTNDICSDNACTPRW